MNRCDRKAIVNRVAGSVDLGLIFRSWKSASCFLKNRFFAARFLEGFYAKPQTAYEIDEYSADDSELISVHTGKQAN